MCGIIGGCLGIKAKVSVWFVIVVLFDLREYYFLTPHIPHFIYFCVRFSVVWSREWVVMGDGHSRDAHDNYLNERMAWKKQEGYHMPYRYGDKLITLFVAERGGVEGRRYRYATQTSTGDTVDTINNKRKYPFAEWSWTELQTRTVRETTWRGTNLMFMKNKG